MDVLANGPSSGLLCQDSLIGFSHSSLVLNFDPQYAPFMLSCFPHQ